MKIKCLVCIATILLICSHAVAQQAKPKSVFKEKWFWLSTVAVSADCVASKIVIDGKRIREGNPLWADRDGTLNWKRAIPAKVATVMIPAIVYRFNPKWGRKLMVSSFTWHVGAVGYTAFVGFKYRF